MKKMFNLIPLIALLLCFSSQNTQAQEINMVDEQNYYEISENSEGLALVVTIDGMSKVADFEQGSGSVLLMAMFGKQPTRMSCASLLKEKNASCSMVILQLRWNSTRRVLQRPSSLNSNQSMPSLRDTLSLLAVVSSISQTINRQRSPKIKSTMIFQVS